MKKKVINEMKCSFPAISANEQTARMVVAAFCVQADPTAEQLADLKTAVSEAVTNAIVHAYRKKRGIVYIQAKLFADKTVWVRVRDKGCGIADVLQARTPLFTTAPEEERSGLGFSVMEAFCDRVSVTSRPERGTAVILEKRLWSKEEADQKP